MSAAVGIPSPEPLSLPEAVSRVYAILEPLSSDQRRRVVQGVFGLLGESAFLTNQSPSDPLPPRPPGHGASGVADEHKLPPKAAAWAKRHGLEMEQLERVFHFDNGSVTCVDLAGSATSKREKTVNTYLMVGVAALLGADQAAFSDEVARQLCEHFGCIDTTNHSKTLKEFGNLITGNKKEGWKLTAPGLTLAAALIKA